MNRQDLEAELEAHHAACYGWALSCCRWEGEEAEDVLQTAYLKVFEGRATFAALSSFRTWLFGVIRLTAIEQRRRRLSRLHILRRWFDRQPLGDLADTKLGDTPQASAARRLRQVLIGLPGRQREVLHLVFYQDLTIREAAQVIGISVGTARTHYERGKQRLRERLRARNACDSHRSR